MSKYFSGESNLSKYEFEIDQTKKSIPSTENLTNVLTSENRKKLENKNYSDENLKNETENDDEYIDSILKQNELVNEVLQNYVKNSKQEIENKFKKFGPAEMFEKINQLIYVVSQLSNRVMSLENTILNKTDQENIDNTDIFNNGIIKETHKSPSITSASDVNNIDENLKIPTNNTISKTQDIPSMPTPTEIRNHLNSLTSGNGGTLPIDEYLDNGINLEELFPHLDDEAYQAGYSAMLQNKNKPNNITKNSPAPGNMRGITGF